MGLGEIIPVIYLAIAVAVIGVFWQLFQGRRRDLILGLSLIALMVFLPAPISIFLCAWVLLNFLLAQGIANGRLRGPLTIKIYVFAVVIGFLALRLDLVDLGKTNLFGENYLPFGFSFLMFQSVAFLLDVSNGRWAKLPTLRNYLSACLFYPTLIMGPFCDLQHHLRELAKEELDRWSAFDGYCLFALGLFKFGISSVIVDPKLIGALPLDADKQIWMRPELKLFLASVFFYTNFSGFFDMIRGLSRIMGVDLPINFRFPFLSTSMADYWRHWHMTLGEWFRDRVFYPLSLVLNRKLGRDDDDGRMATALAGFVTFLLIGLWHGITPKFGLWAVINAALVVFVSFRFAKPILARPLTFLTILLINGLFLSASIEEYGRLLMGIFSVEMSYPHLHLNLTLAGGFTLGACYFLEKYLYRAGKADWQNIAFKFVLCTVMLYLGVILTSKTQEFVYTGF